MSLSEISCKAFAIGAYVMASRAFRLASSPGHSQFFNDARRKTGGPGIRNHVIDLTRMKGGRRVKMSVGEQNVSEVQGVTVHDQR